MVPVGDDVERGLEFWRGQMEARMDGVERLGKRLDTFEGKVGERFDTTDEKMDEIDGQVKTLTAKASVYAALGGLVGSAVVAFVVAFGTKLIG